MALWAPILRYIWCTCATRKGQVPHAHHPLCTPAPPFWQLSTRMGYPHSLSGMNISATACLGSVLVPITQPHQRVKACGSTTGVCMCPRVQTCQCSLCVVFALLYRQYHSCACPAILVYPLMSMHAILVHALPFLCIPF